MNKPSPARYRTTNWSSYNASLRKRGSLLIWVDKEMTWRARRDSRPGRPPVFSYAAIQFCLSIKVLFKLPLRQTAGMVAMPSSRPARRPSHGRPSPPAQSLETRPFALPNPLVARYGDDGADTTAGAASKRRCIV
jgi:hypothetical protein